MNFDKFVNKVLSEDLIPGGKADNMTPESIAKLHNVSVEDILYQLAIGLRIEMEHTDDKKKAKEISLDHLYEFPDYYDRLEKLEKEAKKALEDKKVKEEMTEGGVVGGSEYEGGIAPQDNIAYAKGDARIPKALFTKNDKKKKRKTINIQRRPKTGM